MADADDSYDWSRLGDFVAKIDEGYDLVMGNRFHGGIETGAMPPLHRYLGNPVLSTLARVHVPDSDRRFSLRDARVPQEALKRMQARTPGMEFATEMIVNAAHSGLRITEIPTPLLPRQARPPAAPAFVSRRLAASSLHADVRTGLSLSRPGCPAGGCSGASGWRCSPSARRASLGIKLGIHFLALASLLALLGFNVVGFGVLAKVLHARRCPLPGGSPVAWLMRHYTLERGLLAGHCCSLSGSQGLVWILAAWLARQRGAMEDTVHLAFVASSLCVVGINLLFGAFLLRMVQEDAAT